MCTRSRLSFRCKRIIVLSSYLCVVIVQLFLWPVCDEPESSSLGEDLEGEDAYFDLGPLPSNLLDPPMWSHDQHGSGSCGSWQKPYTRMHRAMLSGDLPPSYLVYTTGQGFPPIIQGIPEAMKGIATVFMLALLTERAFILDFKSPSGFDRVLIPRYIDWRFDALFTDIDEPNPILHIHDIGSKNWFQSQNKSIDFYTKTDFNTYFSGEMEVIQSHSFDFTYALLRNKHLQRRARELGLHTAKCKVCCIWNYLFRHSTSFTRNSASVAKKKLGLTPKRDLIFVDLSFPMETLPQSLLTQQLEGVFSCVEKVSRVLHDPVCVVASNNYQLLSQVGEVYPQARTNTGLFYTRERYQTELQRLTNSTAGRLTVPKTGTIMIPRTEHNALMYFFMGYYLQLNSTVLFMSKKSLYSGSMAAFRHYYKPSGTYVTYPDVSCKLDDYI